MQSSTIRALLFVVKDTVVLEKMMDTPEGKLVASEPSVQEFLRKVTKIISLFLKD